MTSNFLFPFALALSFCFLVIVQMVFQYAYSIPAPINPIFKIEKVFSAPFKPTTMAFLGKDDFLILDRDEGKVFRVMNGTMLQQPVLDVNVATVGYRGMLGIALSKDGNKQQRAFLYYTEAHKDREDEDKNYPVEPIGNRVYGYDFVNGRLINPKTSAKSSSYAWTQTHGWDYSYRTR